MLALTVVWPASQGLTVCRSEEATSNGWPAIAARAKSDTRYCATSPDRGGARSDMNPAPTAKPRTAKEAAIASARLSNHARRRSGTTVALGARRGLRRGRWRRQRSDAPGKRLRRGFTRRVAANRLTQRSEALIFRRERRIVAHRALEGERGHRVELAVERGVEPEKPLVRVPVGHGSVPVMTRTSRSWRAWRERARAATSQCRPASRSPRRSRDKTGR